MLSLLDVVCIGFTFLFQFLPNTIVRNIVKVLLDILLDLLLEILLEMLKTLASLFSFQFLPNAAIFLFPGTSLILLARDFPTSFGFPLLYFHFLTCMKFIQFYHFWGDFFQLFDLLCLVLIQPKLVSKNSQNMFRIKVQKQTNYFVCL